MNRHLRPPNDAGEPTSVDVPFLTSTADLRIALEFDREGSFFQLSDTGRYSRVYAARLMTSSGLLSPIALKVQKDCYHEIAPLEAARVGRELANPEIESLWRREHRALQRVAGTEGLVRLIDVLKRAPDGSLASFPPIFYCRRRAAFWSPPCPHCTAPLEDCRDDRAIFGLAEELASAGCAARLGVFSATTERALWCPLCAMETPGRARFYIRDFPPGRCDEDYSGLVSNCAGLLRDLRGAVATGRLDADGFGCTSCLAVDADLECSSLFSFHSFFALPLARLDLPFTSAAQLLGGGAFQSIRLDLDGARRTRVPPSTLDRLERRLTDARPRFFDGDDPRSGLENLRMKLGLFAGACRGVRALHEAGAPHLDLKPENLMVALPPESGAPLFWDFRSTVIDIAPPPVLFDSERIFERRFEPPFNFNDVYASPMITEEQSFGFKRKADLRLTVCHPISGSDHHYRVEARLKSPELAALRVGPRDAISLVIEDAGGSGLAVSTLFTCESIRDGEIELVAPRTRLGAASASALIAEVDRGRLLAEIDFWLYRCVHVPCDVFSLGIILLQLLLETSPDCEGPTVGEIRRYATIFGRNLQLYSETERSAGRLVDRVSLDATCRAQLQRIVENARRSDRRAWCAKENLFFNGPPSLEAANAVPEGLFGDVLLFALRLATQVADFSICESPADWKTDRPGDTMAEVERELAELLDDCESALFARAAIAPAGGSPPGGLAAKRSIPGLGPDDEASAERLADPSAVDRLADLLLSAWERMPTSYDEALVAATLRPDPALRQAIGDWARGDDVNLESVAAQFIESRRSLPPRLLDAARFALARGTRRILDELAANLEDSGEEGMEEARARIEELLYLDAASLESRYFEPALRERLNEDA